MKPPSKVYMKQLYSHANEEMVWVQCDKSSPGATEYTIAAPAPSTASSDEPVLVDAGWRDIDDSARDGRELLLRHHATGDVYAGYYGLAKMTTSCGACENFPWVILDHTNGVNHMMDGKPGVTHYRDMAPPSDAKTAEPVITDDMLRAGRKALHISPRGDVGAVYKAMIAATPAQPGDVREALADAETWCDTQARNIGNVDGYDYRSGEEAAYRHAAIELGKRAKALAALSAPSAAVTDDHLGIVLSALRQLEEATGETFDDEGGDIAAIEREHNARAALSPSRNERGTL